MRKAGDSAASLARRMPPGSYRLQAPVERSGLLFARLQHDAADSPFEAGITPEADILSLHLSDIDGRAWRDGRLVHGGKIRADTLSLVHAGAHSQVCLSGAIDIIHVFLPHATLGDLAAELSARPAHPAIDGWTDDPALHRLVVAAFAAAAGESADRLRADALALELAAHLVSRHGRSPPGLPGAFRRGGISPHQLNIVMDYMDAHLSEQLHLQDLARLIGLSPFHFLRGFQVESAITPQRWLLMRRIARAKSLLREGQLSLADIAMEVGYSSQSAFTTAFTRVVGVPPGSWRVGG